MPDPAIPWPTEALGDLGEIMKSRGGSKADEREAGAPVIRYGELYTRHHDVIRAFHSFVDEDDAERYTPLEPGDLLFAGSGETLEEIGKSAVFLGPEPAYGSGDILILRPEPSVDPLYLGYASNGPAVTRQKSRLGQGSSVMHIYAHNLEQVEIPLPPLPEQKKIAEILSSVDEAIAATRKVIEQTERVKKGLLKSLMTRGIGHTRFKQTEIGEIPEAWEVVGLEEVAERGSGHTPSKQHPEYWDGDIKWVSLTDSSQLDRVYLSETAKTISQDGIANSSAVLHPSGTVFVSRDASIGRSAIATTELAVSQHFIAWRCSEELDNHFLYYFLQYHKPQFERHAVGSTIKTIGLRYFKRLVIPLPPKPEQETIARSLLGHDRAIWASEAHLTQLQHLKQGLLQDLLTGRVRVPVD